MSRQNADTSNQEAKKNERRRKSIGEIVPEIAKMTTIMITVKLAMDVLAKLTEALKGNE